MDWKGNDFEGDYEDLIFLEKPSLVLRLTVDVGQVVLEPSAPRLREILGNCVNHILKSGIDLPRVEEELFPGESNRIECVGSCRSMIADPNAFISISGEFKRPMRLRHVSNKEEEIQNIQRDIFAILEKNIVGPQKYVSVYDEYKDILDGSANKELDAFLKESRDLQAFKERANQYASRHLEAVTHRERVPMQFFLLDCKEANEEIATSIQVMEKKLVSFQIGVNTQINSKVSLLPRRSSGHSASPANRISDQFEEMWGRLKKEPQTTSELVGMLQFLYRCTDLTVKDLQAKISEAAARILFLMEYTTLSEEDLERNAQVFRWKEKAEQLFESAYVSLMTKKDETEAGLKNRVIAFEEKLFGYQAEVESFRRKDPPVLNVDEMKSNCRVLDRLGELLASSRAELDSINGEEELLGLEPTPSPLLHRLIALREPYDKLWHTALEFTHKHERWFHGINVIA
ncbi:unnamed protein product [Darwinula stevensoni]|uniref:Uncharacterized protein n=1 Tax=Darwinula stevensoni TaxID=69355 RepID=A0A7R8X6L2_9CRUS|nr:unnamed protein product [Darwinula stevensoni]CAG0885873.1 unnamed protein product [Darwinula stevensoni]